MIEIPDHLNKDDVLEAMKRAIDILCPTFVFGYYDLEDIRQEAYIFGLEALNRYDTSRPLENFLYSHIKNRLINFKRDKYHRSDPPCKRCHANDKCNNNDYCDKYKAWKKRNSCKQSLMSPLDIQDNEKMAKGEKTVVDDVGMAEYREMIDLGLPIQLRAAYLKMLAGEFVQKFKRRQVEDKIKEIIGEHKKIK